MIVNQIFQRLNWLKRGMIVNQSFQRLKLCWLQDERANYDCESDFSEAKKSLLANREVLFVKNCSCLRVM